MKSKYNHIHRINHLINKADKFLSQNTSTVVQIEKCRTDLHTQCYIEVKKLTETVSTRDICYSKWLLQIITYTILHQISLKESLLRVKNSNICKTKQNVDHSCARMKRTKSQLFWLGHFQSRHNWNIKANSSPYFEIQCKTSCIAEIFILLKRNWHVIPKVFLPSISLS